MPNLRISLEKVCFVTAKARELYVKVVPGLSLIHI